MNAFNYKYDFLTFWFLTVGVWRRSWIGGDGVVPAPSVTSLCLGSINYAWLNAVVEELFLRPFAPLLGGAATSSADSYIM